MPHVFRPLALAVAFSFVAGCDVGGAAECAGGFTPDGSISGTVAGQSIVLECVEVSSSQSGRAVISGAATTDDAGSPELLVIRIDLPEAGVFDADPMAPEGEGASFEYVDPRAEATLSESGTVTVTEFSDRRVEGTFDLLSTEDEPITGRFEIDR